LQQGGDPSPFDRILATRLAAHALNHLEKQIEEGDIACACLGQVGGALVFTDMEDVPRLFDMEKQRPLKAVVDGAALRRPHSGQAMLRINARHGIK
jgi:6-phosphofructokinase 1